MVASSSIGATFPVLVCSVAVHLSILSLCVSDQTRLLAMVRIWVAWGQVSLGVQSLFAFKNVALKHSDRTVTRLWEAWYPIIFQLGSIRVAQKRERFVWRCHSGWARIGRLSRLWVRCRHMPSASCHRRRPSRYQARIDPL